MWGPGQMWTTLSTRTTTPTLSKFNIATEYFRACYASVEKQVAAGEAKGNLFGLMNAAAEDAIEFVRGKMRLLNPNKFSF